MSRYLVSFYAEYVFLGFVSVWADNKNEAETKARLSCKHRGWDGKEYRIGIEKI